ncbi:hypothetical protein PM082_022345 [Marasmius tenuissimus]|nr:hypothetical protein PM082_022345 [Marasmius tenuissimus]
MPLPSSFMIRFFWTSEEVYYDLPRSRMAFPHLHTFHLMFIVIQDRGLLPIVIERIDRVFMAIEAPSSKDLRLKVEGIDLLDNHEDYGNSTPLNFNITTLHGLLCIPNAIIFGNVLRSAICGTQTHSLALSRSAVISIPFHHTSR